ncbi:MAG: DNA adenine methylase [Treponema sp.]|nr:DNA adenine methylase [Treponema sp.]
MNGRLFTPDEEKKDYLAKQLITCIGNKRALLGFIGTGIEKIQKRLNREKLKTFDVFSGSGIVARFFKQFSDLLIVNDLEKYSAVINSCYLANENGLDIAFLRKCHGEITHKLRGGLKRGFISELYAPKDDNDIKKNERVFFTLGNAMFIDTARQLIAEIPQKEQVFFLAPLLSEASIHANTAGVFKGFYKNRETGIGQFGGSNKDALTRIKGGMELPFPVFSNFNCETVVCSGDSGKIAASLPEVDVAYLDPPYNQHPYGSNYFMLNLIADYERPENISKVSGIPGDWNRSVYNRGNEAFGALTDLVKNIKAKFVLISFNSEGFIGLEQMKEMLDSVGKTETLETRYNAFRGSRNLNNRGIHVKEYLYLLEK